MLAHTTQYGRNIAVSAPLTFYAPPSYNLFTLAQLIGQNFYSVAEMAQDDVYVGEVW
jgi:hypothetical protein